MDLSSLYTTLASPPGQLQQAEVDMMEKFKGESSVVADAKKELRPDKSFCKIVAALSITNLYKSSVLTSKVSCNRERPRDFRNLRN
jgi:hypothetical protein